MNPYAEQHFFSFLRLFFYRMFLFLTGEIGPLDLVVDELQILCLAFLSISCSCLGAFLLLRRSLMMATALSHTTLIGLVSAFFLLRFFSLDVLLLYESIPILLFAAFIAALLTFLLEELFFRVLSIQKDASIALVFNVLFALGIVLISVFTKNVHLGAEIISGNIDSITRFDAELLGLLAATNTLFFLLFYPGMRISSFDAVLAKTLGCRVLLYRWSLFFLTAATIIASFRSVGIILVLAFLSIPYLSARKYTNALHKIIIIGPFFGIGASLIGAALSRHILSVYATALSTGAIVTLLLFLQYGYLLSLEKKATL